jgi:predicted nucleic acid-binding protein
MHFGHEGHRSRSFALPALAWYELTHVLPRVTTELDAARRNIDRIMQLGVPCFQATPDQCTRAMRLAKRGGLSGYDAHYVVLAEDLDGRWVTFDVKAAQVVTPRSRVECLA